MSAVQVSPGNVFGQVAAPPSKSAAHRALIAAGLGVLQNPAAVCRVDGILSSLDMRATQNGLAALGISAALRGKTAVLQAGQKPEPVRVDCMESGSTLRFMIPIFSALGIGAVFSGRALLPERPLEVYSDVIPRFTRLSGGGSICSISGKLPAGIYALPGNISSQYVTGLLLALPLCDGDSRLVLTSPLESAGYVDLTLDILKQAGIRVNPCDGGWEIPGNQVYKTIDFTVEGDWSQAAFLLAAGALTGDVSVSGLNFHSSQGDKQIFELLRQFGAEINWQGDVVRCQKSILRGIDIDASQIPDLVPVLSILAAAAAGKTRIYNAGRLRLKECDRLAAIAECLRSLHIPVEETADSLTITGAAGKPFRGDTILKSHNDHRMVMSMAVAALAADAPFTIEDPQAVDKSWPGFFDEMAALGMKSERRDVP